MNDQKIALTNEESGWITEVAARLRLVQADAASLPAEKRREFLGEEISRKLKELPKPIHKRHLEALLAQFPVAGQVPQAMTAAPAPEEEKPVETFDQVFQRFLSLAENLPEGRKAQVAKKLVEAGVVPPDRGGVAAEVMDKLRKELGLRPEQEPRPARVAELAASLVELVCKMDQAALAALKQMSPRNPFLRAEALRRLLGQFVLADQPPSALSTRAFEALVGAMLKALMEGGSEFGRKYLERMSPEMIFQVATIDAKFYDNKGELAWRRYKELAEDYATPEQINKHVREAMGASIDLTLNG